MNERLPSGDTFMPDGYYPRLLKMLKYEKDARLLKRVQAAVLRMQGDTIRQMAKIVQMSYGTICNWLHALQERGMDVPYWKKPPGARPILDAEKLEILKRHLGEKPQEHVFAGGTIGTYTASGT